MYFKFYVGKEGLVEKKLSTGFEVMLSFSRLHDSRKTHRGKLLENRVEDGEGGVSGACKRFFWAWAG